MKDSAIENIIGLFHENMPDSYRVKEIRQQEQDCRWVVYLNFHDEKYVLKIASNGFTTEERGNGWAELISEYGKMGYYSPAFLKSRDGNFAEHVTFGGKQCVVWEEEFAKYFFQENLDKSVYVGADGKYVYHDEVMEFLGKVGEKHLKGFPGKSGWARLVPFGTDETVDEVMECVTDFDALVRNKAPHFLPRWEKIFSLFQQNRATLEELYPNLLPDLNEETQNSVIEIMLETLRYLRKFYTFSEIEVKAAPLLYKYIDSIGYSAQRAFLENAGDDRKLGQLFDFMEHELLREDIDFRGAMLDEV